MAFSVRSRTTVDNRTTNPAHPTPTGATGGEVGDPAPHRIGARSLAPRKRLSRRWRFRCAAGRPLTTGQPTRPTPRLPVRRAARWATRRLIASAPARWRLVSGCPVDGVFGAQPDDR